MNQQSIQRITFFFAWRSYHNYHGRIGSARPYNFVRFSAPLRDVKSKRFWLAQRILLQFYCSIDSKAHQDILGCSLMQLSLRSLLPEYVFRCLRSLYREPRRCLPQFFFPVPLINSFYLSCVFPFLCKFLPTGALIHFLPTKNNTPNIILFAIYQYALHGLKNRTENHAKSWRLCLLTSCTRRVVDRSEEAEFRWN